MKALFQSFALLTLLLTGCARHHVAQPATTPPPHGSNTRLAFSGFAWGAPREYVLDQLEQMQAKLLTNTPELIRAELKESTDKQDVQVEFTYSGGRETGFKVIYIGK